MPKLFLSRSLERRLRGTIALLFAVGLNTLALGGVLTAVRGFDMAAHPGALALILLSNWWIVVEANSTTARFPTSPNKGTHADLVAGRLAVATGLALFLILLVALLAAHSPPVWAMAVGVVAFLIGIGLRWTAMVQLRSSFKTEVSITVDQPLVRTGVYRYLRHPSESGLLLIGLGAAMIGLSLPALLIWAAALLPLSILRIRLEEQQLRAGFGERYRQYAKQSAALIPKVY